MEQNILSQYLSFCVDREYYALEVQSVREVLEYREITRIPRMPAYMKGVINIRGSVVPVLDLRQKFHLPEVDQTVDSSIIVVEFRYEDRDILVGLLTDMVEAVLDIPHESVQPAPQIGTTISNRMIQGMSQQEGRMLIILNLEQLLLKEELEELSQGIPAAKEGVNA